MLFGFVVGGPLVTWGARYWNLALAGGILGTAAGGALFVGDHVEDNRPPAGILLLRGVQELELHQIFFILPRTGS